MFWLNGNCDDVQDLKPDTWKLLANKVQMSPDAYVCNCGPLSTPGGDICDRWDKTTLSRT